MPRHTLPSDAPEGTVWFGGDPDGVGLCLRVFGDDLDPDEVTRVLGHAPSRSERKGERVEAVAGLTARIARTGSWTLHYAIEPKATIEEGIQKLLEDLPSDDAIWQSLAQRHKIDLFCDVFVRGVNQGFVLAPNILELLGRRRIGLAIDIFCEPDPEQATALSKRLGDSR